VDFAEKKKTIRVLARRIQPRTQVPMQVIDLVVFHVLHLHLPVAKAEQAFARLKRNFVDWNEVRVSSVVEIQEVLGHGKAGAALAESIKGILADIHRQQHETSLEFVNELTIAQARKYLRSLEGVESATIDLVLRLKKAQDVVPLDRNCERVLVRIGVVPSGYSTRQKQRFLQRLIPEDQVVSFHRSVVDLARAVCHEDERDVRCAACPVRQGCGYSRRLGRRNGFGTRKKGNG
jgi:endonuclease III